MLINLNLNLVADILNTVTSHLKYTLIKRLRNVQAVDYLLKAPVIDIFTVYN